MILRLISFWRAARMTALGQERRFRDVRSMPASTLKPVQCAAVASLHKKAITGQVPISLFVSTCLLTE